MYRNFGIGSPLGKVTDDNTVKKGDPFTVENYQQAGLDYNQMKKEIDRDKNARERLTNRYGGEWNLSTDRYGRVTWRNQDNRTVKDVESTFLAPNELGTPNPE